MQRRLFRQKGCQQEVALVREPPVENTYGAKSVSHTIEHRIDWGHVALGVGLLLLAYVLHRAWLSADDDEEVVQ